MEPDPIDSLDFKVYAAEKKTEILHYFSFAHLANEKLRAVSRQFAVIAVETCNTIEPSAERTAGLRKLLEAKDCIVRAALS